MRFDEKAQKAKASGRKIHKNDGWVASYFINPNNHTFEASIIELFIVFRVLYSVDRDSTRTNTPMISGELLDTIYKNGGVEINASGRLYPTFFFFFDN